jgi:hypothetical protein
MASLISLNGPGRDLVDANASVNASKRKCA